MAAPILFTNVRIFDGTGAELYPGEVLVEGNRIAAVAPAPTRLDRAGAEVVDGGGATLMPGMVEAHAHLSWPCAYRPHHHATRPSRRKSIC